MGEDIPTNLHPFLAEFFKNYITVGMINDRGLTGLTCYCLRQKDAASVSADEIHKLRQKLLAVKIPKVASDGNRKMIANEVRSLEAVRASFESLPGDASARRNFLPTVDFEKSSSKEDDANSKVSWFVMGTVEPSITLTNFFTELKKVADDAMLEYFRAHVFLESLHMLEHLHNTCGVAHGDFYQNNLLVEIPPKEASDRRHSFPPIRVIDFDRAVYGNGNEEAKASALRRDLTGMFKAVNDLLPPKEELAYARAQDGRSERLRRWDNELQVYNSIVAEVPSVVKTGIAEVRDALEAIAIGVREEAGADCVRKFYDAADRIAEMGVTVANKRLRHAVEECQS